MKIDTATNLVAYVGDWYGQTPRATTALTHAYNRGADIVLSTGSVGIHPTKKVQQFLDVVEETLTSYKQTLYFVDGVADNHPYLFSLPVNDDGLVEIRPHIFYLPRGTRFTISGVQFLAFGGGYTLNRRLLKEGRDYFAEQSVTQEQVSKCLNEHTDVLLLHDRPTPLPPLSAKGQINLPPRVRDIDFERQNQHRQLLQPLLDTTTPYLLVHGHYRRADRSIYTSVQHQTFVISLDEGFAHQAEHLFVSNLEVFKFDVAYIKAMINTQIKTEDSNEH